MTTQPPSASLSYTRSSTEQIIALRTKILRPGWLPDRLAHYPQDALASTSHWAAMLDGVVIGCATFHLDPCPASPDEPAIRLRGMAVEDGFRGQQIGQRLMSYAMTQLAIDGAPSLLWCNARERAVSFYQRLGFVTHGERFEIEEIGPHFVMWRRLPALIA